MASSDLERVIVDAGKDTQGALNDLGVQTNAVTAVLRRRIKALEAGDTAISARLDGRIGTAAPSVTGSKISGAALDSLLTQLAAIGLIEDNTTF